MKKMIFAVCALLMTQTALVYGAEVSRLSLNSNIDNSRKTDQVGVGAQVGSLPGVNVEYWINQNRVYQGSVSIEHNNTALTFGHNWMFRGALSQIGVGDSIVPYAGVGALAVIGQHGDYLDRNSGDNVALGGQIPLGLEFLPLSQRFSIFGQIAPTLEISPISYGFLTGDVGARFYF